MMVGKRHQGEFFMGNRVTIHRRAYKQYQGIYSAQIFQEKLFCHALDRYQSVVGSDNLGSVLAICASSNDAQFLVRYPFEHIVITGIGDQTEKIAEVTQNDPRVRFQQENAEALSFSSRSFDLVFCKYGLHHLPRPALGLYEMLRCCRQTAIFIEPYDSPVRRVLEASGYATNYERMPVGYNVGHRDNYVFPFERRHLVTLLNSYYLDSGYQLELHLGWYSSRHTVRVSRPVSAVLSGIGWAMQYVPGAGANIVTAIIQPGNNLPSHPTALSANTACKN
jgi:SAM-dependent methyltransferase